MIEEQVSKIAINIEDINKKLNVQNSSQEYLLANVHLFNEIVSKIIAIEDNITEKDRRGMLLLLKDPASNIYKFLAKMRSLSLSQDQNNEVKIFHKYHRSICLDNSISIFSRLNEKSFGMKIHKVDDNKKYSDKKSYDIASLCFIDYLKMRNLQMDTTFDEYMANNVAILIELAKLHKLG